MTYSKDEVFKNSPLNIRDLVRMLVPAGQLVAAAGWTDASQMLFTLVVYLLAGVFASPGRRQFLPGPLSPPYPVSHSSAMVRMGLKCFHSKNNTHEMLCLIHGPYRSMGHAGLLDLLKMLLAPLRKCRPFPNKRPEPSRPPFSTRLRH